MDKDKLISKIIKYLAKYNETPRPETISDGLEMVYSFLKGIRGVSSPYTVTIFFDGTIYLDEEPFYLSSISICDITISKEFFDECSEDGVFSREKFWEKIYNDMYM